jgi:hypothetical protein
MDGCLIGKGCLSGWLVHLGLLVNEPKKGLVRCIDVLVQATKSIRLVEGYSPGGHQQGGSRLAAGSGRGRGLPSATACGFQT